MIFKIMNNFCEGRLKDQISSFNQQKCFNIKLKKNEKEDLNKKRKQEEEKERKEKEEKEKEKEKEREEKENEHAKFLFYIDPPGEDEKQVMNIFKMSEFEKDYYFLINSQNLVYKSDSMLCSGDIVENNIKKRNEEEKDKKENKIYSEEDKNKALANFYDFVLNIKNYKYNFFSDINLKYVLNLMKKIIYM